MSGRPRVFDINLFCDEETDDLFSTDYDTDQDTSSSSLPSYNSPPYEEIVIGKLIETETHHMPKPDYPQRYRDRSIDFTVRQDSINWIFKVTSHYGFQPLTAFLSVNYFDRFLSVKSLPSPKGWPFQLLAVACLSLAAKMEELRVPLLEDLPKCALSHPTIIYIISSQRFLLYPTKDPGLLDSVISSASDLILSTTRASDFLGFPPSTIAAAAVLCIAEDGDFLADGNGTQLPVLFHERVNNEMVRNCQKLMEDYVVDTSPEASHDEEGAESAQPSCPAGVLDAAVSTSGDTCSEAEPDIKRLRVSE
ncbi:cyclin-D1-1-like [Quillaja saponaria]|uniref:B-like cyclin n=1 Tax=Quillaja saponaria TaxID=32244 RepID=A0AAD7M092_QUISA|nr:cyclin-D1-1-like [Quillaja saponaria]